MVRKLVLILILTLLIAIFGVVFSASKVKASGTIYIRADGSVDPPGSPISSTDNITYTFTADINEPLVVERDNIVIDGSRHTLYGGGTFSRGIDLTERRNITIADMEIKAFWEGICVWDSTAIKVYGINVTANKAYGIHLIYSPNNQIFENHITANRYGVGLSWSSNNTMYGNNITNHHGNVAIYISNSFNNTLYGNTMHDNDYDLEVHGQMLGHFMHSIDVSNLIDGTPIYYLVNQTNLLITPATHPQIGYLAVINCFNTTVTNLNLTSNGQGLLLAYTNNSRITGNRITANSDGIWLYASFNNTISKNNVALSDYDGIYLGGNASNNWISSNNITSNAQGINLDAVSNNVIHGNNITDNNYGIYLWKASNCRIYENTLTTNEYGVWLESESTFPNNTFYHNNFVDNYQHAHVYLAGSYISGHNFWDNGIEGNYWSNYTGVDLTHDGIGDTIHLIDTNNTDNYPLMGMFHHFNASLGSHVNVISNSTIEGFQYFETNSTIKMYVSNMTLNQTCGFCRVTIAKNLMPPPYTVIINGDVTEVLHFNGTVHDNGTHRWIHFAYEHSTHEAIIIPEFTIWTSVLLMLIAITPAITLHKQRSKSSMAND